MEKRLKRTNKKKCPNCQSENIYLVGKMGNVVSIPPGGEIPEPDQSVYECKDCGELFILIEDHSN
jgi:predicted RNA-binding Zn-ribbon protein involved in translation (DUF1610 family)